MRLIFNVSQSEFERFVFEYYYSYFSIKENSLKTLIVFMLIIMLIVIDSRLREFKIDRTQF